MKLTFAIILMFIVSSIVVLADPKVIKQGEEVDFGEFKLKLLDVIDKDKVVIMVNSEQLEMRSGGDHKYQVSKGVYFFLKSAANNYLDPGRNMATFEVFGIKIPTESNVGVSEDAKWKHVFLFAGQSKILNGVEVALVRILDQKATLIVNGEEILFRKDDDYKEVNLEFNVAQLMNNPLDERLDKVDLYALVATEEEGSGVALPEPTEIRTPVMKPIKQESKETTTETSEDETDLPEPEAIEEDLPEAEESSEESGFFAKLWGWIIFWN